MPYNEYDKIQKIKISVNQLRNYSGEETLNTMVEMINSMLKLCVESIKKDNPKISEEDLIKEVKRIYWLRR